MAAISLVGNTKIPHALSGMGFAAAVVSPRLGDPNFYKGINEVLEREGGEREGERERERER